MVGLRPGLVKYRDEPAEPALIRETVPRLPQGYRVLSSEPENHQTFFPENAQVDTDE